MTLQFIQVLPLLVLLAIAAVIDWRHRRIPNWLNLLIAVGGIARAVSSFSHLTFTDSMLGFAVGFGMMIIPFVLGALGGGDVKLLAAVGTWMGPIGTLLIFAGAALVGLVIVITQASYSGRLSMLFKNSAVLAVNFAHFKDVGAEHIEQTGKSFRSIDRPLPYAVPVFAAVILVMLAF